MPVIPGLYVAAGLSPGNVLNTHETHRALYGKGGYRSVSTTTERNQIPPLRREEGMLVYVAADQVVYKLKPGAPLTGNTTDSDWDVFNSLGGSVPVTGTIAPSAYADIELGPTATYSPHKYILGITSATEFYGVEIFISKDHTVTFGFSMNEYGMLGDIDHGLQLVISGPNLYLRIHNYETTPVDYKFSNYLMSYHPPTTGDVFGPPSSTDNALVRFDGTTGKVIKNSGVILSNTNDITGVSTLTASGRITANDLQLAALATPPSGPNDGDLYYDTSYKCVMFYDSSRSKWLSLHVENYAFSINSASVAAGVSFRVGDLPTSATPLHLGSYNTCLVGLTVTTAAAENFTLGVADTVVGSNVYTYSIPNGRYYANYSINSNFDANNAIDVYVSALGTSGNINRPMVTLSFRRRK